MHQQAFPPNCLDRLLRRSDPSTSIQDYIKFNIFHHGQHKKDAHEQMSRHVGRLRARAKFMRQTLREALYCRLGSVVRGVTPAKRRLVQGLLTEFPFGAYGGFVMPCLDPVLIMTDWFS